MLLSSILNGFTVKESDKIFFVPIPNELIFILETLFKYLIFTFLFSVKITEGKNITINDIKE